SAITADVECRFGENGRCICFSFRVEDSDLSIHSKEAMFKECSGRIKTLLIRSVAGRTDQPTSTAPPFTLKISPVMKPACSVQRKRTGAAISSGVAARPRGIVAYTFLLTTGSLSAGAAMSVATQPGATQLTRMPWGASSVE